MQMPISGYSGELFNLNSIVWFGIKMTSVFIICGKYITVIDIIKEHDVKVMNLNYQKLEGNIYIYIYKNIEWWKRHK